MNQYILDSHEDFNDSVTITDYTWEGTKFSDIPDSYIPAEVCVLCSSNHERVVLSRNHSLGRDDDTIWIWLYRYNIINLLHKQLYT